jgi:hypothetical protein
VALSRTDVGIYESSTAIGTAAFTTPSFTPPANSLLVVSVGFIGNNTTGDLGTPTIEGGSLTYTSRSTAFGSAAWSTKLAIFTAPVGGSPSSMTIKVDDDNNQNIYGYTVSVVAFTGYDTTTPIAGIVSSGSTNIGDGEEKQTLSATPAEADVSLLFLYLDSLNSPPKPSLAAGWTKIHEAKTAGEGGLAVARRETSTSTEVKVTDIYTAGAGGTFSKASMISLIVKAAAESEDVTIVAPAAAATATSASPGIAVSITAAPGAAVAAASAPAPTASAVPPSGAAAASGPAPTPTVATGAPPASAAAQAPAPVPAASVGAGAARATAGASAPAPAVRAQPPIGVAAASAPAPTPRAFVASPPAPATAAAPVPSIVVEAAPAIPLDLEVPTKLILDGGGSRLSLDGHPTSLGLGETDSALRLGSPADELSLENTATTVALVPTDTVVLLDDRAEELILDG